MWLQISVIYYFLNRKSIILKNTHICTRHVKHITYAKDIFSINYLIQTYNDKYNLRKTTLNKYYLKSI